MIRRDVLFGEQVLAFSLTSAEDLHQFQMNMILSNPQLPLVSLQCLYTSGVETLVYKINALRPAVSILKSNPRRFLLCVLEAVIELSDYQLTADAILLDIDYIFWDDAGEKVKLVYLPLKKHQTGFATEMSALITKILQDESAIKQFEKTEITSLYEWILNADKAGVEQLLERIQAIITPKTNFKTIVHTAEVPLPLTQGRTVASSQQESKQKRFSNAVKQTKGVELKRVVPMTPWKERLLTKKTYGLISVLILVLVLFVCQLCQLEQNMWLGLGLITLALEIWGYQKLVKEAPKIKQEATKLMPDVLPVHNEKRFEDAVQISEETGEVCFSVPKVERDVNAEFKRISPSQMPLNQTVLLGAKTKNALTLAFKYPERKEFPLDGAIQTIGRNPAVCNICLEHMSIGRIHAELHQKEDKIFMRDLNSTNGSYVNGIKLLANEYHLIQVGDQMKFGEVEAYLR